MGSLGKGERVVAEGLPFNSSVTRGVGSLLSSAREVKDSPACQAVGSNTRSRVLFVLMRSTNVT